MPCLIFHPNLLHELHQQQSVRCPSAHHGLLRVSCVGRRSPGGRFLFLDILPLLLSVNRMLGVLSAEVQPGMIILRILAGCHADSAADVVTAEVVCDVWGKGEWGGSHTYAVRAVQRTETHVWRTWQYQRERKRKRETETFQTDEQTHTRRRQGLGSLLLDLEPFLARRRRER